MVDMRHDRPVLTGLLALAGVGLVVGLLLSGAALAGSQVLGLGDDASSAGTGQASAGESMYLPTPSPTPQDTAPQVTLSPDGATFTPAPAAPAAPTTAAAPTISLQASATQVRPGERIDLSGVYPSGEGATLAVERNVGGTWTSFVGVTATVRGQTFTTYIRTSQAGSNTFRVHDLATDLTSNEITFTVG